MSWGAVMLAGQRPSPGKHMQVDTCIFFSDSANKLTFFQYLVCLLTNSRHSIMCHNVSYLQVVWQRTVGKGWKLCGKTVLDDASETLDFRFYFSLCSATCCILPPAYLPSRYPLSPHLSVPVQLNVVNSAWAQSVHSLDYSNYWDLCEVQLMPHNGKQIK